MAKERQATQKKLQTAQEGLQTSQEKLQAAVIAAQDRFKEARKGKKEDAPLTKREKRLLSNVTLLKKQLERAGGISSNVQQIQSELRKSTVRSESKSSSKPTVGQRPQAPLPQRSVRSNSDPSFKTSDVPVSKARSASSSSLPDKKSGPSSSSADVRGKKTTQKDKVRLKALKRAVQKKEREAFKAAYRQELREELLAAQQPKPTLLDRITEIFRSQPAPTAPTQVKSYATDPEVIKAEKLMRDSKAKADSVIVQSEEKFRVAEDKMTAAMNVIGGVVDKAFPLVGSDDTQVIIDKVSLEKEDKDTSSSLKVSDSKKKVSDEDELVITEEQEAELAAFEEELTKEDDASEEEGAAEFTGLNKQAEIEFAKEDISSIVPVSAEIDEELATQIQEVSDEVNEALAALATPLVEEEQLLKEEYTALQEQETELLISPATQLPQDILPEASFEIRIEPLEVKQSAKVDEVISVSDEPKNSHLSEPNDQIANKSKTVSKAEEPVVSEIRQDGASQSELPFIMIIEADSADGVSPLAQEVASEESEPNRFDEKLTVARKVDNSEELAHDLQILENRTRSASRIQENFENIVNDEKWSPDKKLAHLLEMQETVLSLQKEVGELASKLQGTFAEQEAVDLSKDYAELNGQLIQQIEGMVAAAPVPPKNSSTAEILQSLHAGQSQQWIAQAKADQVANKGQLFGDYVEKFAGAGKDRNVIRSEHAKEIKESKDFEEALEIQITELEDAGYISSRR